MAGREPDRRWGALLFGLCLLAARGVAASPTVVLLRAPSGHGSWRAAEGRTGDELRAMGLRVEEVRALPTEVPRILEEGAQAVVRIERVNEGASVEIWVADAVAGPRRLVLAEVPIAGGEAVATAALRTAEQVVVGITEAGGEAVAMAALRAAEQGVVGVAEVVSVATPVEDVELGAASGVNPVPTRTVVIPVRERARPVVDMDVVVVEEARPVARPVRASRPRRLGGLVQAAALGGPGGVGVLGELAVALRAGVSPRVSIDPTISAAVAPVRVQAEGGSIRVGYVVGELMLGVAPGRVGARVGPRLGLGGGVAAAWARGQARDPLQGATDVVAIGVLAGNVGVAIRVRERLRLLLGAGIRVLLAPVVVRVRGEEVARLGPVVIRGSVGVEWDWWRG